MSTLGWFISTTVYLEAWYFIWNMSALLLCQIKPLCHFQNSPKKVRRSRPRKRERSTRRSTWESGVRRCAISWSSPSISSHININHLILITVNVIIISSSAHRWQWWQWQWRKRRSDSRSFLQIKLARWSLKAGELDQQRRIMKMLSSHSSLGRIEKSKNEICL